MKQKFESIPGCHVVPGHLVHCTRCGIEYPSTSLVYGRRDGDTTSGLNGWNWYCAQDNCYGRSPQSIYPVTIEFD